MATRARNATIPDTPTFMSERSLCRRLSRSSAGFAVRDRRLFGNAEMAHFFTMRINNLSVFA